MTMIVFYISGGMQNIVVAQSLLFSRYFFNIKIIDIVTLEKIYYIVLKRKTLFRQLK